MVYFAARFCRNIFIPRPENMKITEKQVLELNGYEVLRNTIYCVLKCDFDGFKFAVNKGVTLQRFPVKEIYGELVMLFLHCRHTVTT